MALAENLKQNKHYHKLAKKLGLDYIEVLSADEHGFVHDPQTDKIICKVEPIAADGITDHLNVHKVIKTFKKIRVSKDIKHLVEQEGVSLWDSEIMLGTFYAKKWTWYPYVVDDLKDCVPIVASPGFIENERLAVSMFEQSKKKMIEAISSKEPLDIQN